MYENKFHITTISTLRGPWHVGSKDLFWYVVNVENGKSRKIGPFRNKGTNYCDRAKEMARERNRI